MNTKSWAGLLRHLLYLFIFVIMGSGIVLLSKGHNCLKVFHEAPFAPLSLPVPRHAIEISVDMILNLTCSLAVLLLITSVHGLVAVCTLNKWDAVNFTFGICALKLAAVELILAIQLGLFVDSLNDIVETAVKDLFNSANYYNASKFSGYSTDNIQMGSSAEINPEIVYSMGFEKGWSLASEADAANKSYVDFMQINLRCCGTTGRSFWKMWIPRSCCPLNYRGKRCVLSVAFVKSCLYDYHKFSSCSESIKTEYVCFGITTLLASFSSLYLARLKVLYPDGEYESDLSSEEDEQVEETAIS